MKIRIRRRHVSWLLLCVFLFTVSGCASPPTVIPGENVRISAAVGERILEAELGDPILQEGEIKVFEALDLKADLKAGGGIWKELTIPAQVLVLLLEDDKWRYYFGRNITFHDSWEGTNFVDGGLKLPKDAGFDKSKIRAFGGSFQGYLPMKEVPDVEQVTVSRAIDGSLPQSLIFAGAKGNIVQFRYMSSDLSRGEYEAEHNLDDGDVFELHGAQVRIVSASATRLKFQVLSSFEQH